MDLSIGLFIIPTIVLLLVMLLYFYFKRQVQHKKAYRRMVIIIAATAFMLNLIWEVAQGPLYEGFEHDLKHVSFCALASVADLLMVLILFFGLGFVYKNVFWIKNMGANKVLLLAFVGFLGAILAEVWHTMRGDWAYDEVMPLIPLVDVGISPILQFTVLPWLIFMLGKKFIGEKAK